MLGLSPTLVRALIPKGEPRANLSSLRAFCTTGEPWNPDPYLWLFERVGGARVADREHQRRHRGRRLLPHDRAHRADQAGRARLPRARAGHGRRRLDRPDGAHGPGRRARLPPAVARDDARDLGRRRALPRDVLAALPRRVDARRLGVDRRGRLLVSARPLRRHAQHRRQADRAGGARVGRDLERHRRRGGGGRRPARGEGRGGVDLLRRRSRASSRTTSVSRTPSPTRSARRSSRSGSSGSARCRRRARRRSSAARFAHACSGRIPATCPRSRTRNAWRRSAVPLSGRRARHRRRPRDRREHRARARGRRHAGDRHRAHAGAGRGGRARHRRPRARRRRLEAARTSSAGRARPATVDLLVCNAGISGLETPLGDPDEWWRTFEVNVLGLYLCCNAFAPRHGRARRRPDREHRERRRLSAAAREPADGVRREQGGRPPLLASCSRPTSRRRTSSSSRSAPAS